MKKLQYLSYQPSMPISVATSSTYNAPLSQYFLITGITYSGNYICILLCHQDPGLGGPATLSNVPTQNT